MARIQKRKYCKACKQKTLHVKDEPRKVGCAAHMILIICTLGLWLFVVPLMVALQMWSGILAPYRCQVCGRKN